MRQRSFGMWPVLMVLAAAVAGVWTWRLTEGGAVVARGLPDGDVLPAPPLTGEVTEV